MRDLMQIVEAFERLSAEAKPAALATVVSVEGSSYRRPGARMLVAGDGQTAGTVSGGCLERDVARRAGILIADGEPPLLVCYQTDEDETGGEENAVPVVDPGPSLGCGGRIEILIQRLSAEQPGPLAALGAVVRRHSRAALATVFRIGAAPQRAVAIASNLYFLDDEDSRGDLHDPLLKAAISDELGRCPESRSHESRRHALAGGGWADVLLEWLKPQQDLAIFGDGHDVGPLLDLAKSIGWRVRVIGWRPLAGLRRRFPAADELICALDQNLADVTRQLPADSAAVVMAHHFNHDAAVLTALMKNPPAYVGVLGPRHRTVRILSAIGQRDHDFLFYPVGLDIGAETPEQIALSILAEIQATVARRPGGFLRARSGPIHLDRDHSVESLLRARSER